MPLKSLNLNLSVTPVHELSMNFGENLNCFNFARLQIAFNIFVQEYSGFSFKMYYSVCIIGENRLLCFLVCSKDMASDMRVKDICSRFFNC